MPGSFEVVPYVFSALPVIVKTTATVEEVAFLKRAITAFRADDEFYIRKQACDPAFGGISEDYVLVYFYSDAATAMEYVDWLNSVYDQTLLDLGFKPG